MGEALGRRLGIRHIHHTGADAYEIVSRALKTYETKGFEWMDRGDFDINLLALRNSTRDWRNYDDILYAMYREDGEWVVEQFSVTTEPQAGVLRGAVWAKEGRPGAAILQNGQWKAHAYGLHKSKYPALTQHGLVKVWRDGNKDFVLDYENSRGINGRPNQQSGYFGINIHGHSKSDTVQEARDKANWTSGSAGCTISKYGGEIPNILAPLAQKMNRIHGRSFPTNERYKNTRKCWVRYTVIWDTEFEEAGPQPSDKQLYPPLRESTHITKIDTKVQVIYPDVDDYVEPYDIPANTEVAVRIEKDGNNFEWSKIEALPDSDLSKKSKFFYIKSSDLQLLEGVPESAEMSFKEERTKPNRTITDAQNLPTKPWIEYGIDTPWFNEGLAEHRVAVTSGFDSLNKMGAEGSSTRENNLIDVLHKGLTKIFEEAGKQNDSDFIYELILNERLIFGKVLEHYVDPKASASARFLVSIENKYVEPLPESKPDYDFRTEEEQVDYRVFSDNIKKFSDQILKLKSQIDGYEGKVRVYQVEKESQLVLDYKKSFDELLLLNGLTQEGLNKLASLPPRLGEEGQIVIGWKTGYRASYISIFYNNELIEIKKGLRSFKFKKEVESVRVQEIIHRINKIEDMSYTLSDFIENFVTEDPPEFIPDYDASDANDSAEESMGPSVKTIEEYKKEQNFVQNTERKKETYQKRKKEKNCTQSSIATKNSLPKTKKALEQSKKVFRDALNSISISHLFEDALACLQVPQITNDVEVISEFLKELPKVPTMFVFDDFPTDDIASEFVETLRDTLAFMVKNVITGLLKSAIDSLLSCKDDDVETPNQVDPFELAAAIDKLDDSFNPEEVEAFVDGLATFLSSDELCTLLSGEATEETLQLVQNYIERFFPNLKIQTKSEIENFFITLGESVDFSICFEAMVPQKEFIDPRNLCLEDNELRRRILSEKEGITDSEIEDQILRHNQRRKQLADRIKSALNSPPLSGAFQAPDLFCQRVAGRPISEKNPGVISFSDPTFSEMVDTTVDSMFSSFRDKFNREADDYFSSFFTISTKEFIDPTTQEVTLIPTRELLPSLSKFYSNPTPVIQHEVEALKIPIQENYELLGELQRFIDKREENLQDDRLRKKQIRFIFERLGITIDTPPIAIQGYLRQAVERSNDNINSLRATKLQLIAELNRTDNEAVKIGIQEEIDVIDFSIQVIFQPIAELGDQEFPTANIQSLQQELREIIEREEEVSLVAGQNILPSNSPSRELTLELYKAGNFYDYKISLEQGVFLDVSTGTFPEQSYRNARNLSAAELNFVESTTDVAHRMPLTFFKKLIQKKLSPFSLTPEDLNSIPYPRIYKSLKVKFIEEISKKINSSPYFKEDKGKKAIELIELVKKSSSPECDSHILRLKTLMKEIKDNFSKEFCIDTASLEGKPSKTPFETELMRACIRLTVRHYILEGLLRSIISNSVFATSELEEQAIFDFTFDLMKAEMQKYGTYYDDFLKEVGEWLLDPDLPDQEQPSPNEVMKGLFEAEYYEIKLAFEIAIMKPRQLSETVKEFFINKILLDTEEIMSRQNEHDYRFELGHHSDLVVQRAVRFSFIGGDEELSRNRVFYENESNQQLETRVRDYAQELVSAGLSKQQVRNSIKSYYVICLVQMDMDYASIENYVPGTGLVNSNLQENPTAEKAFLTPGGFRIVIPIFETRRRNYASVFTESPTHQASRYEQLRKEIDEIYERLTLLRTRKREIESRDRSYIWHDRSYPLLDQFQVVVDAIIEEINQLESRKRTLEAEATEMVLSGENEATEEIPDFTNVSISFNNNTLDYAKQELKISEQVSVLFNYIFPLELYKSAFIIHEMASLSLMQEVRNALLVSRDELNILFYTITPEEDDWKKISKPMQENSSEDILSIFQFNFGLQLGSCKSDLAWNFGLDVDWGKQFKGINLGAASKAAAEAGLQVFKDYVEKNDPNIKLAVYLSKLQRLACIDVSPTENSIGLSIANPLLYGPNPLNAAYNALGLGYLNKKGSNESPNVEGLEKRDICEELREMRLEELDSSNDE